MLFRSCNSSECTFLHRLPPNQSALPNTSLDVFGREKHADYRDDMGGVGSFTRQNRTLYIGRIKEGRNTAETIERHFEEFGEIEKSAPGSCCGRGGGADDVAVLQSRSFRLEASLS